MEVDASISAKQRNPASLLLDPDIQRDAPSAPDNATQEDINTYGFTTSSRSQVVNAEPSSYEHVPEAKVTTSAPGQRLGDGMMPDTIEPAVANAVDSSLSPAQTAENHFAPNKEGENSAVQRPDQSNEDNFSSNKQDVARGHSTLPHLRPTSLDAKNASFLSPILEDPASPVNINLDSPTIEATSADQGQVEQRTERQNTDAHLERSHFAEAVRDSESNDISQPMEGDLSWLSSSRSISEQQHDAGQSLISEDKEDATNEAMFSGNHLEGPFEQPDNGDTHPRTQYSFSNALTPNDSFTHDSPWPLDGAEVHDKHEQPMESNASANVHIDHVTKGSASSQSQREESHSFFDDLNVTNSASWDQFSNVSQQKQHADMNTVRHGQIPVEEKSVQNPTSFETTASGENVEDSWEKAFADRDSGLNDSWDAAFAEGFGDDGLLNDDEVENLAQPGQTAPGNHQSSPQPPQQIPTYSAPRYSASISAQPPQIQQAQPSAPMKFFEELPISQPIRSRKPKQQTFPPSQPPPTAPPHTHAQTRPTPPPRQSSIELPQQYGTLRGPERLDPFPRQPSVPVPVPSAPIAPHPQSGYPLQPTHLAQASQQSEDSRYSPTIPRAVPQISNRYSPAPQAATSGPMRYTKPPSPAVSRYASSPGQSSTSSANVSPATKPPYSVVPQAASSGPPSDSSFDPTDLPLPPLNRFAPRIPSPLSRPQNQYSAGQTLSTANRANLPQGREQRTSHVASILGQMDQNSVADRYSPSAQSSQPGPSSPSDKPSAPSQYQTSLPPQQIPPRPERPRTSSPETTKHYAPQGYPAIERPASAQMSGPGHQSGSANVSTAAKMPREPEPIDFVLPNDETAVDPLQRWKGRAILAWGPGGVLVTSFPKHVPRYGGGQAAPKMRSTPGEVKVQRAKDVVRELDHLTTFPGPLRGKNKKKEVLTWLSTEIEKSKQSILQTSTPPMFSLEEHLILLEALKLLVEQDGVLGASPGVDSFVRTTLSPGVDYTSPIRSVSSMETTPPAIQTPSMRAVVIQEIRQHLLRGEREKAVWHAVDNRLWAHAMLLSSTVNPEMWKQVIREFVHKDVRGTGDDGQSLATLYEVFAGNHDESVEELVSVSARAGLQMMSTIDQHGHTRDALEGLNKWRETLGLILCNRSKDDERAIHALGKLLANYGRTDAAHVCFIFARSVAQFSGADDPQADFAILGSPTTSQSLGGAVTIESILLTEVYEYALSLPASTSSPFYVPHLQPFKLHHARILAEMGNRNESTQYCDAVAAAFKSTTRASPYYHPVFLAQLDDTVKLVSQVPRDGSSSWISKPSVGKVSSSVWKRFEGFIAGEEADTGSVASGYQSENEPGPFAKAPGSTPEHLSRPSSQSDLYAPMASFNSRYAPASGPSLHPTDHDRPAAFPQSPYSASPDRSSQGYRARRSVESLPSNYGSPTFSSPYLRQPPSVTKQPVSDHSALSSYPVQTESSYEPYVPQLPQSQPSAEHNSYPIPVQASSYHNPYDPAPSMNETEFNKSSDNRAVENVGYSNPNGDLPALVDDKSGYQPSSQILAANDESSNTVFEAAQSSFEPLSGGYEPPSYEPQAGNIDTGSPDEKPARRRIMEDDGDDELMKRVAALKHEAPRPPSSTNSTRGDLDPAVKAALEAQAAEDSAKAEKKGWFPTLGLWGKKDGNGPPVHTAKLGEANSFVYDEQSKRWVSKKAGVSASQSPSASPAPPPPRTGPPPRSVSGPPPTSTPPANRQPTNSYTPLPAETPALQSVFGSAPPSRADSPNVSDVPVAGPAGPGMSVQPPSRPATGMSGASNDSTLDDLIGGPGARKGGTIKKGKKSNRYVDVMAK